MSTEYSNKYVERILNRTIFRYYLGLFVRWRINLRNERSRRIAKRRGALIGHGVVITKSLAKKANSNLIIGDHVSIQTDDIDLRSPVKIGNNVIIGQGVKIITASHNIDSTEWEFKTYGVEIEDYVWIATNATILPSCRRLSYGTVVGGGFFGVQRFRTYGCSKWQSRESYTKEKVCTQQTRCRIFAWR